MFRKRPLLILLAVVVVLGIGLATGLAYLIRDRSLQAAQQLCGPHSRISIRQVDVGILRGSVSWQGLLVEQEGVPDTSSAAVRAMSIEGRVDSIIATGISIWDLVVHRVVRLGSLRVAGADLLIHPGHQPADTTAPASPRTPFAVQDLRLERVHVQVIAIGRGGFAASAHLAAHLTGLSLPSAGPGVRIGTAFLQMDSARAFLPPLYDLTIGSTLVSTADRLLRLEDITLLPRLDRMHYGEATHFETDLFHLRSDAIDLSEADIPALLATNVLKAHGLHIGNTMLHVDRDKTLPDRDTGFRRMPARLLRELPCRLDLDSVLINGLTVAYSERDALDEDFGDLVFQDIRGSIAGLATTDSAAVPEARLAVKTLLYGEAPMEVDMRTAIFDHSDRYRLHARIGALPFRTFNRMTRALMRVKATHGMVLGIDYVLDADDDRATGRVDLEYKGLQLAVNGKDGQRNGVKTFLAGLFTRNNNLRGDAGFRHGDLAIERYKDRQVFNYTWRGLREGIVATLMPGAVLAVKQALAPQ